jgi:glycolate oxidase iron-sulfur subunit
MQTHFSLVQLCDPDTAESEKILRACVHCGFCTATCPTYLLTGDELDSPRGRIYLIKEMLEANRLADSRTAFHIDRCLSCLSCMTTCPSGVHYMHLVDHARERIEKTFPRSLGDRLLRRLLAFVLPRRDLFRASVRLGSLLKPLARYFPGRSGRLFEFAPKAPPAASAIDRPQVFQVIGKPKMRVALLSGCVQPALNPAINEATIRLLTRHGVEVVVAEGAGCCGALPHHLGKVEQSHAFARRNIEAWSLEIRERGLDYVVINTSGCGVNVKDYGHMFRNEPDIAEKAAHIAAIARDISEIVSLIDYSPMGQTPNLRVAYHSACSLRHGQKIVNEPIELLQRAGFEVLEPPESHICCGSAGTYNLLQPELADELRERKVANIQSVAPQLVASGNLGCMVQIGSGTAVPVVHTVELLDWASGGPAPEALREVETRAAARLS